MTKEPGRAPSAGFSRDIKADTKRTAEEIVSDKVNQFAKDRRRIAHAMAKRFKVDLPPEVDQFFEAVAGGRWTEHCALFDRIKELRDSGQYEGLRTVFGAILEAQLVAECAHGWPAQKLLDYGQSILGSLQPGMVYVGGTDPGRGIPTLLNETSEGDRHIILTQNGLADATYLQYVNFLYHDQLTTLTSEETDRAFSEYLADAQKRLLHDQQFPDEPKQVRPGEEIQFVDGSNGKRVQVSGQIAVMAINERLLQSIMDKNPDLSFALEESFPLRTTYGGAVPLGPIMELRAQNAQNAFTAELAAQAVDYWQAMTQQMISDPEAPAGSDPRKTYSHMAWSEANLLADHNFNDQAEQAYRLAMQLEPSNPEAVYGLSELLAKNGRMDEARQMVEQFQRAHPDLQSPPVPWVFIAPQPATHP
ncbi:MAG TPA: tetratricopeptide repeat protein [Candidatus Limnocylindrales bacterium]|nr:tetratricopeptide repeat protein [Candidatus Limnocylindrales bacterium]